MNPEDAVRASCAGGAMASHGADDAGTRRPSAPGSAPGSSPPPEPRYLGKPTAGPTRALDTFPAPRHVTRVTFTSDELTTFCPITGQPDFNTITIEYGPDQRCIESKSLKLYLWSYRDERAFCEALAAQIATDIYRVTQAHWVRVTIRQHVRGGIVTEAVAERRRDDEEASTAP